MGDEQEGDADFALKRFQLALHLFAQIRVERGERFVEQQQLRAIDESARQRDALLLAAAQSSRPSVGESLHLYHLQRFIHATADFIFRRVLYAQTVGDVVAHAEVRETARSAGRPC